MKKIIALACSVLLVAGMTMTTMAAPSVESVIKIKSATDKDGKDVPFSNPGNGAAYLVIEPLNEEDPYWEHFEDIDTAEELKAVMGSYYEEGMSVLREKKVYLAGDEEAIKEFKKTGFPITVTFTSELFKGTSKVVALHYDDLDDDDNTTGKWEVVGFGENGNDVTAKFNSLSPVAFVAKAVDSGSTGDKAPQTGDTASYTWMLGAVMVVAVGAVVVSKKKYA